MCTSPKLAPSLCPPLAFPGFTSHLSFLLLFLSFGSSWPHILSPPLPASTSPISTLFLSAFDSFFHFPIILHPASYFLYFLTACSLHLDASSLLSSAHFSLLFCAAISHLSLLSASGFPTVSRTHVSSISHAQRELKPQAQSLLFMVFAWNHLVLVADCL